MKKLVEPLIAGDCFLAQLCLNMLYKKRLVQENWMSMGMKSNQKIQISVSNMLMPGHINWDANLFRFGYILLKPHTELSLHKSHATMGIQMYNKGVHSALCLFWMSLPSFPRQDVQMCRSLVTNQGNQHYMPSSPQAFSSMATALSSGARRKAGGPSIAGI